MATPAIRALRKMAGPESHLVGIMRPYVAEVLRENPWFDETILCDKRSKRPEHHGRVVLQKIRAAQLDTVVLLTNSFRTAWLAWRSGTPERVGFSNEGRGWLLTKRLPFPQDKQRRALLPAVDAYLHLAQAVGCDLEPPRMELATTAADERLADAVWKKLDLPPGEEVVVLNSGGAFGGAKHWPVEHFAALAQKIAIEKGLSVLVNCGPAEREIAREIVSQANDRRVVSLADEEVPLGLSKACIRRSRLLVTTDSGPRFFGIAFGKPVVTLFGPTDPLLTQTHYQQETSLSLQLDCQPCMKPICPLGHHRCMRDLSVATVYQAVLKHLTGGPLPREVA